MKNAFTVILLFEILLTMVGCAKSEPQIPVTAKPGTSLKGIWTMEDSLKMAKFVKAPDIKRGYYCLDFQPDSNLTLIQFLESPITFKVQVKIVGDKQFKLINDSGVERNVKISTSSLLSGETSFHWHFLDSSPYNPKEPGERDGTLEEFSTLQSCVDYLRAMREEAQAQEEEFRKFPPFKDYQTPPQGN